LKKRTSINSISILHKEKEMADFRKWLFAFAVVALLLGMGSSAYASGNVTCVTSAVPHRVRAEGIAELMGDVLLSCTGGVPTPAGVPIPLTTFTISLNTNVTSRLYPFGIGNNLTEALLAIDEPFPGAVGGGGLLGQNPVPGNQTPIPGASLTQLGCQAVNDTACAIIGTGGGFGGSATSPYNGAPGRFNVFQGLLNSVSSIVWQGVPFDAPGTAITRIVRITNVRGNACQLGTSSTLIPTQITELIGITGAQQVTFTSNSAVVAQIVPGLIAVASSQTFQQCVNINGDLLSPPSDEGQDTIDDLLTPPTIILKEGYDESWKVRTYSQLFSAADTATPVSLATNGAAPTGPIIQNVLGFPYTTESGYVSNTPGIAPNGVVAGAIGLADTGTQFLLQFNNVGAGVALLVPTTVALVDSNTLATTGLAVLVNGSGTLSIIGGTAQAVYEVYYSNSSIVEVAAIPVTVVAQANTSNNLPGLGTVTMTASFNPLSSVQVADPFAPIPRFCNQSAAQNLYTIIRCECNLLFPFVTNQAGFDTGIAIANTSLDTGTGFFTLPQSGPITLFYYGVTAGGGAAPPAFTSDVVNAGDELVFNLSSGGGCIVGTCGTVPATPGFEGYVISQAQFQYCHAFAFISDVGAQKLAEGYLAIQLDFPTLNRTGQVGENLGH
jgi:hypothetical protein